MSALTERLHQLPEVLYWEVASLIPTLLCESCGKLSGALCECWRRQLPVIWSGEDIYTTLNLWCESCQDPENTSYCICYRVRLLVAMFEE